MLSGWRLAACLWPACPVRAGDWWQYKAEDYLLCRWRTGNDYV